jgi:DNA-binding transcriptional ArsR family regulator
MPHCTIICEYTTNDEHSCFGEHAIYIIQKEGKLDEDREDQPVDAPASEEPPILPESMPVEMPELPLQLVVNTPQQYKALGDETRTRILGIIRHQPATAKQIADRLGLAPGTISHHLQVLEAAGLAKVVARRQVRGIVAKYYTRTARIFAYERPPDMPEDGMAVLDIATSAYNELRDAFAEIKRKLARGDLNPDDETPGQLGFPHARISLTRAAEYTERMRALIDEFNAEPIDPDGIVYGFFIALFSSPDYMQVQRTDTPAPPDDSKGA